MSTFTAGLLGVALAVTSHNPAGLSLASREPAPESSTEDSEPASETETPSEAKTADGGGSAESAIAEGDLDAALERARTARETEPSAEHWVAEAAVLERRGELLAARDAYAAALEADGADAIDRTAVEAKVEALEERSRGRVADEPASTHREQLDAEREERMAPQPESEPAGPAPAPVEDVKIVKKWYFWVTLAAIVASAGAITGIAIKAATDERKDSLDRSASLPSPAADSPALIRF